MSITFTSFKKAAEIEAAGPIFPLPSIWSSAVYQPNWLPQRPKAAWMDIRPEVGGNWIRPREFIDSGEPLAGYFQSLLDLYDTRVDEAIAWLNLVQGTAIVCCWCPYDKAAKRQLEEFGTFVCHTAAVGEFVMGLGMDVIYDSDRTKMVRANEYVARYG